MSGPARAAQLRLTEEVGQLRDEIDRLRVRVGLLEAERFELVSSAPCASDPFASGIPASEASEVSRNQPIVPPLTASRRAILVGIGAWLKASLEGKRRGVSGRDSLPEGSTCYIVVRNFKREVFHPVLVTRSYTEVCAETKRGGDPGDSIFIGLPSIRDARIVVSAANFVWPVDGPDGE